VSEIGFNARPVHAAYPAQECHNSNLFEMRIELRTWQWMGIYAWDTEGCP